MNKKSKLFQSDVKTSFPDVFHSRTNYGRLEASTKTKASVLEIEASSMTYTAGNKTNTVKTKASKGGAK